MRYVVPGQPFGCLLHRLPSRAGCSLEYVLAFRDDKRQAGLLLAQHHGSATILVLHTLSATIHNSHTTQQSIRGSDALQQMCSHQHVLLTMWVCKYMGGSSVLVTKECELFFSRCIQCLALPCAVTNSVDTVLWFIRPANKDVVRCHTHSIGR